MEKIPEWNYLPLPPHYTGRIFLLVSIKTRTSKMVKPAIYDEVTNKYYDFDMQPIKGEVYAWMHYPYPAKEQ